MRDAHSCSLEKTAWKLMVKADNEQFVICCEDCRRRQLGKCAGTMTWQAMWIEPTETAPQKSTMPPM